MPTTDPTKLADNIRTLLKLTCRESRRCKSCNAPIWLVPHNTGKTGVYDEDGTSHFITCPDAKAFRAKLNRQ